MTAPLADGVMAATHKLVQQAMTGQWHAVPKTIEERRVLLEQLSASARPQDREWLSALQQAMAESDAAVARMRAADPAASGAPVAAAPQTELSSAAVDDMLSMLRGK
jgi:recombinational DNA repair ATPase RecF